VKLAIASSTLISGESESAGRVVEDMVAWREVLGAARAEQAISAWSGRCCGADG
jgi:hypothetical protein